MPRLAPHTPEQLRPYIFHGLRLDPPDGRGQCLGECPSCGSGKFSITVDNGFYSCYSASCPLFVESGGGGGSTKFIRWLWNESDKRTTNYTEFATDRGLLMSETLSHWGVCQSVISGAWLFPAYNPDGALVQLYKRIWADDRWELRPTPFAKEDTSHGHAMHGLPLLDRDTAETIYLAEGPGDAMVLWEALRVAKLTEVGLEFTANPATSLLAKSAVLAVANCGAVGEPLRRYLELFRDKRVVLCFDNDHPKQEGQDGAGWAATKRAAGMLAGVAREVCRINWGGNGFNAELRDGWDVRDALRVA